MNGANYPPRLGFLNVPTNEQSAIPYLGDSPKNELLKSLSACSLVRYWPISNESTEPRLLVVVGRGLWKSFRTLLS